MHTIYLALGSNVGNKKENITQAINLLQEKVSEVQLASFYTTKPVGYLNQDVFLNTVLKAKTALTTYMLLTFIQEVEKKVGRVRRFTNGPREIDIDILFYNNTTVNSASLIIPHPRISERDFVLKPLCDISPELMHPLLKKTCMQLLNELPLKDRSIIAKQGTEDVQ